MAQCVSTGVSTTFEYYENGGQVDTYGLEADLEWRPLSELTLNATLALLNAEFADDFAANRKKHHKKMSYNSGSWLGSI